MPLEIRLPELGDSVTHARLTAVLKREGDRIAAGEPIAEVETDKTSVEIPSPGTGVLRKIYVRAGSDVPVDALIALVDIDNPESGDPEPPLDAAHAERIETAVGGDAAPTRNSDEHRVVAAPHRNGDKAIPVSPVARRMALIAGIPLSTIVGSGPAGRITKRDVDAAMRPAEILPPAKRSSRKATLATPEAWREQQLSTIRKVTAERMVQAKQTIPHFYLRIECAMDETTRLRERLNERGEERYSVTAFAIRAAGLALQRVPAANAAWVDGTLRVYEHADIAVAVNTSSGLVAPIIRQAETKSLTAIAREVAMLAGRAREGRLTPDDCAGGSFTISNLGMYGVTSLYPIINQPQACILGLGAVEARPVVRDGVLAVGKMVTCTLSADHRALDGATAAEFLVAFRRLIEDPWSLLL